MARKIWEIQLDGNHYSIELQHGTMLGKRRIFFNGKEVELESSGKLKLNDPGSRHPFYRDGHGWEVVIHSSGWGFTYELAVDGKRFEPGIHAFEVGSQESAAEAKAEGYFFNTSGIVFSIAGLFLIWYNWKMAHSQVYFWPMLAMLGPGVLVLGLSLRVVPKEEFSNPESNKIYWVIGLAILAALANYAAMEFGWY